MSVVIMKSTFELLVKKIETIKAEIKENTLDIQKAAEHGDLSENAEYEAAKEKQIFLFNKLRRFEGYMNCKVVDGKDINSETVTFGNAVRIVNTETNEENTYNIAGPVEYELESLPDVVTYTSPLAKMLIGRKEGDVVEVKLPARTGHRQNP